MSYYKNTHYNHYPQSGNDFIPDTFTLGRFNDSAFITCKFNKEKWVSPSMFERLCGYKPHTQRDTCKELKKAIFNAVETMENVPTKGFRLVSYGGNLYNVNEFNTTGNVVLHDPRGFNFSVTLNEFFDLLSANGGNMKDNVLDNIECVYAWTAKKHWRYLMPTNSPHYAQALKKSKEVKKAVDETVYIGKRDLVVGRMYSGSSKMPGKFIYMGEHDVYSNDCQLDAFSRQSYSNVQTFIKRTADITAEKRHVFYRVGATGLNKDFYDKAYDPYVCRGSLSKLLLEECQDGKNLGVTMYNSDKPCSYENVLADMEKCMRFHRIDLAASNSFKLMSKELFSKMLYVSRCFFDFRLKKIEKNFRWPFSSDNVHGCAVIGRDMTVYDIYVRSDLTIRKQGVVNVTCYPIGVPYENFRDRVDRTYVGDAASEESLYKMLCPQSRQLVLDNGEVVDEAIGALFTRPDMFKVY